MTNISRFFTLKSKESILEINHKPTMALEERRSFSASRIGRKKGTVCSITDIFSRNDLLSSTQW